MTTFLVQAFCVLLMIFFGAMAYYPLFLGGEHETDHQLDDQVISVGLSTNSTPRRTVASIDQFPSCPVLPSNPDERPAA